MAETTRTCWFLWEKRRDKRARAEIELQHLDSHCQFLYEEQELLWIADFKLIFIYLGNI